MCVHQVFDNASKELGFFVDERLMNILQEMPDEESARLIKIDKILSCLGLTTDDDIKLFVTFFLDEKDKDTATAAIDQVRVETITEKII